MRVLADKENMKLFILLLISLTLGFLSANISVLIGFLISLVLSFLSCFVFLKNREDRVNNLITYLKALNNEDYSYVLKEYKEGELAKLHSELNKTTVIIKNKNQELMSQREITSQAIEDISHQLKTPVSSLLLLNELQEENDLVIKSRDQLDRLNYLSNSLLTLVKLDSNLVEFNLEKHSLNKVIQETLNLVTTESLTIKIIDDYKIGDNLILCDLDKMKDALFNVINNKLRYANNNISITISEDNLSTYIKISDDGERIDDYEREKLFERFYSGKKKDSKSIGIGLSIAKEYTEKQDGKLFVEEDNTFVFKFDKI